MVLLLKDMIRRIFLHRIFNLCTANGVYPVPRPGLPGRHEPVDLLFLGDVLAVNVDAPIDNTFWRRAQPNQTNTQLTPPSPSASPTQRTGTTFDHSLLLLAPSLVSQVIPTQHPLLSKSLSSDHHPPTCAAK